ncbi:5-oxoprolinase subunit PxpA [Ponticaulis sp.]|uniref:5-oxoprolinase subunit PxpA n=1 Tax=Ponticaulis sp. TaxID=2020902 RepID=UPI00260D9E96|nr:5-oxoprolinase subunit PxpA [Ponticaulis sp.]MDF1681590.1 5-oxoprolinase subunit PxpA [Ponticaulis sp.]
MTKTIDLNADIGELEGDKGRSLDADILSVVTSCNIACGGHAGDEESMRQTLRLAKRLGVKAGAHPSYPDRENFGRVSMAILPEELRASLRQQVQIFIKIAEDEGVSIAHLKPHGALYNDAAKDENLAVVIAGVAAEYGISTIVGLPSSEVRDSAIVHNLQFCAEGFADRAYEDDGSLRARTKNGAVLDNANQQARQALELVSGNVTAFSGEHISLDVQTICLHGDTPGAFEAAKAIRAALEATGVSIGSD